jgi:DNA invertase Pin-like site-specific DNA recombinase
VAEISDRKSLTSGVTILKRIVYTGSMTKTPAKTKLRLVAYGRVSTSGQVDGYGPDVQTKAMRKWARANGHTLVDVLFDEAVSGTVDGDERPELSRALALVAAGDVDGVLVPNMDRLARELTVQEGTLAVLWAHGGRFFTVEQGEILPDDDSDPMRKFVRQVMGAAAELERGLIVKRLKSGRAAKKAAGKYAGGAPAYGQQAVDGALEADDDEAAVLARVQQMRAEGASYRAIAAALNEDGVPTKRGGRWQPTTVARMVDAEARQADADRAVARRARAKSEAKLSKAAKLTRRVA